MKNKKPSEGQRDLIERLRDIRPFGPGLRSMPANERLTAEQARYLVAHARKRHLSLTDYIWQHANVELRFDPDLPIPCASQYNEPSGTWRILVRGSYPAPDQRYDLLREFKRIVDARDGGLLYDPSTPIGDVEQYLAANYFARLAVMPEREVRRAVRKGARTVQALSDAFAAPVSAVRMRVSDLDFDKVMDTNQLIARKEANHAIS